MRQKDFAVIAVNKSNKTNMEYLVSYSVKRLRVDASISLNSTLV